MRFVPPFCAIVLFVIGYVVVVSLKMYGVHRGWINSLDRNIGSTKLDPGNEPPGSAVVSAKPDELLLHYVRLYHLSNRSLSADDSLGFLDCMGAYSAIVNLKPASIYVHTNAPWFWPFANCETLLNITIDWSSVKLINAPLHVNASGKRIERIEHEADLRKLKAVEGYGGISMDFDVLILNGTAVRNLLRSNRCILCAEPASDGFSVNAGFLGCQTPHSRYPQLVLKESYETNFIPNCWVCNSGVLPWQILARHSDTAVVLDDYSCSPNWVNRDALNVDRGRGKYDWGLKPIYHTFYHNPGFNLNDAQKLNSSLGDMFRWLLMRAPPALCGKMIPPALWDPTSQIMY